VWLSHSQISSLSTAILALGKVRSRREPNLGWVMWCFANKACTRAVEWVGAMWWWSWSARSVIVYEVRHIFVRHFSVTHSFLSCQVLSGWPPACHRLYLGSFSGRSLWHFWWKTFHWDGCFFEYCVFFLAEPPTNPSHPEDGEWGALEAPVPRTHSVTPQ